MNKDTKIYLILGIVVILIVIGILWIKNMPPVSAGEAKCIAEKSVLYVQAGCHACKIQEDLFGSSYKYLNTIDCLVSSDTQKCIDAQIAATPTWIINGERYEGVQTIAKLKEITGC